MICQSSQLLPSPPCRELVHSDSESYSSSVIPNEFGSERSVKQVLCWQSQNKFKLKVSTSPAIQIKPTPETNESTAANKRSVNLSDKQTKTSISDFEKTLFSKKSAQLLQYDTRIKTGVLYKTPYKNLSYLKKESLILAPKFKTPARTNPFVKSVVTAVSTAHATLTPNPGSTIIHSTGTATMSSKTGTFVISSSAK